MTEPLKVLDLFSGIGGFSLGLERTGGFKTIAFCEIDNYCQRVLKKHWPEVYIHSDIRTLTAKHFDGYQRPDVICGGFPCQDVSLAGNGAGIAAGTRSGLWFEYARLIRELRPRYVIVENVSGLLANGMGGVVGDLAGCGYDCEWQSISAAAVGAPHIRDRVWIVAYPNSNQYESSPLANERSAPTKLSTDSTGNLRRPSGDAGSETPDRRGTELADSYKVRRNGRPRIFGPGWWGKPPDGRGWSTEPNVGRVANGIPARAHRLRALGNSIVPQIAQWIGERILEANHD